jgi:hypothetical protein
VYHGDDLRKLIVRCAAVLVVCVFASLPTLARVHDRLSAHDDVSSFRPSKNVERPHEKVAASTLAPLPARRIVVAVPTPAQDVVPPSAVADDDVVVAPRASRAPPAF